MGHGASKEKTVQELANETNLTQDEIELIKRDFERVRGPKKAPITKTQFKEIIARHINGAAQAMFMERLFDAFDINGDKTIDLEEFIAGYRVFLNGSQEEKLDLSFRLYDLNRDGSITLQEITDTMREMYSKFFPKNIGQLDNLAQRLFEDLDINGDGTLSQEEFRLLILKEPAVVEFWEQFLIVRE